MTKIPTILSCGEYFDLLSDPVALESFSAVVEHSYLLVEPQTPGSRPALRPISLPNCPVIEVSDASDPGAGSHPLVDLSVHPERLNRVLDTIISQPVAAALLVQLLRHNAGASVSQGLLAESLAYSTLQHGSGFQSWLRSRHTPPEEPDAKAPDASFDAPLEAPVIVQRAGSRLLLSLDRPSRHNAFNLAMRDALCEALSLAHADNEIEGIVLQGNGPSFCSGGDLTEFGSAQADAGTAHLIRTTRSAAALLHSYTRQRSAHVHGACIGAGIELAAFCDEIQAAQDTFFQLPEVTLGLVPGAGGTVSLTHRIGRQRTAYMALSNERIDAQTALRWGLIDEVDTRATMA